MLGTSNPVICNGEFDAILDNFAFDRHVANLTIREGIFERIGDKLVDNEPDGQSFVWFEPQRGRTHGNRDGPQLAYCVFKRPAQLIQVL